MLAEALAGVDSLRGGLSLLVAGCDSRGRPTCTRGVGLRAWPDRRHVTVFVPLATSEPLATQLRENPRVACVLSRPTNYLTVQLKGVVVALRTAAEADRALVESFVEEFAALVDGLGVPREIALRVTHWPCLALDVRVEETFQQTPGPGAGEPFGAAP